MIETIDILANLSVQQDWSGIYGGILHYGMIIAFSGSALLAFLYFWLKGRLDIDEEPKIQMMRDDEQIHETKETDGYEDHASDLELYGDPGIASKNAPVPRWLTINNWFWVAFGFVWLYLFWNGSFGWLDRGYWNELQRAANTTYPYTTREIIEKQAAEKRELRSEAVKK